VTAVFLVMQTTPAFFEQPTPFPHIPFAHSTFATHFDDQPVNFCWIAIFGFKKVFYLQKWMC
jgi:hypothetical protein